MTARPLPHEWLNGADVPNSLAQQAQENFEALATEPKDATGLHNPVAASNFLNPGLALNTSRQISTVRAALVWVDFEIDTVTSAGDATVSLQISPDGSGGTFFPVATTRDAGLSAARDFFRVTPVILVPIGWYYLVSTTIVAPATVTLNQIREAVL